MIAREIALPVLRPHMWLIDNNPIYSEEIKASIIYNMLTICNT